MLADLSYSGHTGPIILFSLVVAAVVFLSYHFGGLRIIQYAWNRGSEQHPSMFRAHVLRRLLGFLLMGMIPLLLLVYIPGLSPAEHGINLHHLNQSTVWIGMLMPLVVGVNMYFARKPANLKHYPQVRLQEWNIGSLTVNFTSWALYLLGYEMLFRGFLLFTFYHAMGAPAAVAINVLLYALAHIPKGRLEVMGAVPFGVVLCLITITTGSFFAAFVLHAFMALSNEFIAIRYHPDMRIKSIRL